MKETKRALISVSDKTGVAQFAKQLSKLGYQIISTGGTQKVLQDAGIEVISAEEVTGYPECFGGRVKTMHPAILGGVLFRRDDPDDLKKAEELNISSIDLVVINLYPFEKTVNRLKKDNGQIEITNEVIEQIDIGGPTLLRSAAKNHRDVTVVCDIADYNQVIEEIKKQGNTSPELRRKLAAKVFLRTAAYDSAITGVLSGGENRGVILEKGLKLRYGENPHQIGFYYDQYNQERGWEVLQEHKQMSYLNLLDADAAWKAVMDFEDPTVIMVKHANPSGISSHKDINEAFQRAYDADRLSAFGVIIALNCPCTAEIVRKIIDQKIFVEILIAPEFKPEALNLLKQKEKIRVIKRKKPDDNNSEDLLFRSSLGGILMQNEDSRKISGEDLTCVTDRKPTADQVKDLLFAWKVVKHAKSNAIVLAKDQTTVGIGCGQTSRVDATWIAARRAGEKARGSVLASDAFFPFPDGVEEAVSHGVSAIIQPGGSVRDQEVIAKANELKIAMVTTGFRAFRH